VNPVLSVAPGGGRVLIVTTLVVLTTNEGPSQEFPREEQAMARVAEPSAGSRARVGDQGA